MNSPQPADARAARAVASHAEKRAKRWVWGCTAGCLVVLGAFAAAVFVGFYLLMQPLRVPPADTFLTGDVSAFLVVRIDRDDPLMLSVPYSILAGSDAQNRMDPERAAVATRYLRAEHVVREVAPIQVVCVRLTAQGDAPPAGGAVLSLHKGSRLLRLGLGRQMEETPRRGQQLSRYEGARLATAPDGTVIAFKANSFMFSGSKDLVRRWVDRLGDNGTTGSSVAELPDALQAGYDLLAPDRPVWGVAGNADGELDAFIQHLNVSAGWRDALLRTGIASPGTLCVAGQMETLDARRARVDASILCADESFASSLAAKLKPVIERVTERTQLDGLQVFPEGPLVRLSAELPDAPAAAGRAADRLSEYWPAPDAP